MAEALRDLNTNETAREPRVHIDLHLHLMIDPQRVARIDPLGAVDRGGGEALSTGRTGPHRTGGRSLLVFAVSAAFGLGGLALIRAAEKPSPNLTDISGNDARRQPSAGYAGRASVEDGAKTAAEVTPAPGAPPAGAPAGPTVFGLN